MLRDNKTTRLKSRRIPQTRRSLAVIRVEQCSKLSSMKLFPDSNNESHGELRITDHRKLRIGFRQRGNRKGGELGDKRLSDKTSSVSGGTIRGFL